MAIYLKMLISQHLIDNNFLYSGYSEPEYITKDILQNDNFQQSENQEKVLTEPSPTSIIHSHKD